MPETFNPYYTWLGIPPEEQPANHYRLLGISLFESNRDAISNAADQRMAHLRTMQAGKNGAASQLVLNEVSAATTCLLTPEKKQGYDQALRQKLDAAKPATPAAPVKRDLPQAAPLPAAGPPVTAAPRPQSVPSVAPTPRPIPLPQAQAIPVVSAAPPVLPIVTSSPKGALSATKSKGRSIPPLALASIAGIAAAAAVVIVVMSMFQPPQVAKESTPKKLAAGNASVPAPEPKQHKPGPEVTPPVQPLVKSPETAVRIAPIAPEVPAELTSQPPVPRPIVPIAPAPAVVKNPATPVKPNPPAPTEPEPPAVTAQAVRPSKMPSEGQLAAARKLLLDTFGAEAQKATDVESKKGIGIKLHKLAEETQDDLAARYVLIDNARKMFIGAGEVTSALVAADKTAEWFELDSAAAANLRQSTCAAVADAPLLSAVGREELADRVQAELTSEIAKNRLAAADEYSLLGLRISRGLKDPERKRIAAQQRTLVIKLKSEFSKFEQAQSTLKEDAANPAANLIAGKYLCTVLNDWSQGLAHLAAGGDATLGETVETDQRAQADAEKQGELQFAAADAWFNWSERAKSADRELLALAKARAHHWYQAAAPKMTGLNKIKAEKRIAALAPADAPTPRPTTPVATADTTASKKTKPAPKSRAPAPVEMATAVVCEVLQGKRPVTGLSAKAEEFKAPNGDGRSGANGFVLMAGDAWKKQGSTWKCKYTFNGSGNGLKMAHPIQNGQLLVSLNGDTHGFGLNAGGNWSDVGWRMAGQRKIPFEITMEGQAYFPLALDTEHEIVSQLTADGRYGLFINQKLIAFAFVTDGSTQPLDLRIPEAKPGSLFSGGSMPRVLKPGEALAMVGPLDNGINKLTNIEFGPKPAE